jgi:hypothetical protein
MSFLFGHPIIRRVVNKSKAQEAAIKHHLNLPPNRCARLLIKLRQDEFYSQMLQRPKGEQDCD